MCTRSAPATASPGVAATFAPNASSARAFASVRFQTVTASPRRSIPSTIAAAQQPGPQKRHTRHRRPPGRIYSSVPPSLARITPRASARQVVARRARGAVGRMRGVGASRACSAGPAIPKAARRSSRPTRRIPIGVVGFDVEIAALLAAGLGRTPRVPERHVHVDRPEHRPRRRRHRPERHRGHAGAPRDDGGHACPYYEFREVLSVRDADAARFRSLADLRGKTVGTLGGTIAYEILLRAEREHGLHVVSYDDDVHPYSDLVIGRVDAVLLDNVLAERRHRAMPGFTIQPQTVAIGHYVGVLSRGRTRRCATASTRSCSARCATARSSASSARGRSGTTISRSCTQRLLAGEPVAGRSSASTRRPASRRVSRWEAARRYLPSLLRASVVTIVLSCLSMALAVALGVLIATGRVYGGPLARAALTALRRADPRHADPAAAVRALLRPRRRRSGCRRSSPRCSAWR